MRLLGLLWFHKIMPEKDTPQTNKISIDRIKQLMEIILPIPRWWMVGIAVVFIFASIEIRRSEAGSYAGSFRITGVGLALLALIWLPSLLKLIGLTGIGLKTSGVEASTGGLLDLLQALDPSAQRETLPPVIAALDLAATEGATAEQPRAQEIKQKLQDQLASLPVLPKDAEQARSEVNSYAREYERMRREMPGGSARTIRMGALVSRVMALARQAKFTSAEIKDKFASGADGDRLVVLAMIRALADSNHFDIVAQGISPSSSPFEQYEALRAAQEMMSSLSAEQRARLETILIHERSGAEGTLINKSDMSRWNLSAYLLDQIATMK